MKRIDEMTDGEVADELARMLVTGNNPLDRLERIASDARMNGKIGIAIEVESEIRKFLARARKMGVLKNDPFDVRT